MLRPDIAKVPSKEERVSTYMRTAFPILGCIAMHYLMHLFNTFILCAWSDILYCLLWNHNWEGSSTPFSLSTDLTRGQCKKHIRVTSLTAIRWSCNPLSLIQQSQEKRLDKAKPCFCFFLVLLLNSPLWGVGKGWYGTYCMNLTWAVPKAQASHFLCGYAG